MNSVVNPMQSHPAVGKDEALSLAKPGEPVQSYVLRLKELYRRLEEQDTEQAPTDSHLRDQFMLGLEDGALLRALKRVVRLAPDTTFSAIQQEALILEEENMGSRSPHATCAAVREHNPSRSHPQAELWKQELKREIVDELKDFTRELLRELRPNSPVHVPIHRNAPQRSTERRYNPQFADRRDERAQGPSKRGEMLSPCAKRPLSALRMGSEDMSGQLKGEESGSLRGVRLSSGDGPELDQRGRTTVA
uniref:Gag protein n=1 Tax=Knipowitschia caucasica TaxID=637954 RepID=A0AAV2K862_KNICA